MMIVLLLFHPLTPLLIAPKSPAAFLLRGGDEENRKGSGTTAPTSRRGKGEDKQKEMFCSSSSDLAI